MTGIVLQQTSHYDINTLAMSDKENKDSERTLEG